MSSDGARFVLHRPSVDAHALTCVACGGSLTAGLTPWLLRCTHCRLETSLLGDATFNGATPHGWDVATAVAMTPVRERAAASLCERLSAAGLLRGGRRLLDIGCGPGWFLRAAAAHGLAASGIEPDAAVAADARAAGLEVETGSFPAVQPSTPVDIVTLNDVFEHLPAPAAALAAIHRVLVPGGLLVLNLPSSDGFFYRLARLCARLGWAAPLERLWQKGFESPHLYYYAPANLTRLVEAHGFRPVYRGTLPALTAAGLWGRLRAGGGLARLPAAMLYLALRATLPLLELAPSDIMVLAFRRS